MKIVKGMYTEAKIFTDDVEDYAEAQVKMICDNEVVDGSNICMMPDIHPGKIAPTLTKSEPWLKEISITSKRISSLQVVVHRMKKHCMLI